jgi:hypothetical protein
MALATKKALRPSTTPSNQVQSRQMVSRSGFGLSGARFSGGG